MKTVNSKQNLCSGCNLCIATCNSSDIKFGNGKGNDNVIECSSFKKRNYKTPIEEILFRSSKIGLLAGGLVRNDLTENQKEEMNDLEERTKKMIGLTVKQQETLDKIKFIVSEGTVLSSSKIKMRDDYEKRLVTLKGLTDPQQARLDELKAKDGAEPSLSQGAKTYIKDVWLWCEKRFKEEISSKHTRKGLQAEEDGLNLISFVDGVMYVKNEERKTIGHLTGECDANTFFKEIEKRIIDDIKCSWNPKTFMSASLTTLYEWQGRGYLYLYDADIFRLRYCLVDCPQDVYAEEYKKFCFANNIVDDALEIYQPLIQQFDSNFMYERSGNYSQEERVKTFAIQRDKEKEAILLKSIELGIEYFKTITLNMIE
jgi:hypothetical protein